MEDNLSNNKQLSSNSLDCSKVFDINYFKEYINALIKSGKLKHIKSDKDKF
jgi:hypothetical protein